MHGDQVQIGGQTPFGSNLSRHGLRERRPQGAAEMYAWLPAWSRPWRLQKLRASRRPVRLECFSVSLIPPLPGSSFNSNCPRRHFPLLLRGQVHLFILSIKQERVEWIFLVEEIVDRPHSAGFTPSFGCKSQLAHTTSTRNLISRPRMNCHVKQEFVVFFHGEQFLRPTGESAGLD